MYIPVTYEQDFDDLWMHLKSKYPEKLFNLDGVGEQLDMSKFSKKFFSSAVTSDASIDANANVDDMSVIAYEKELPKPFLKMNSYYILWKELKKLYGRPFADSVVEMQLTGDIYINDMHGIGAGKPYCFNYSTYDILTKGLPMVKKVKCEPPKYLYSFKSQLEQFVTIASNSTLGASGTADMLIMMAYYVKNMLNTLSDAHFTFADEDAVWRYVRENLVSFVYTINQPMRGNQCVTEDTEVLTPGGWKKYDELYVGDDIYTWHDNELRIQQVQRVNVNDYDGEMHHYFGRDVDFIITPNHRVVHQKNNSDIWEIHPSSYLIDKKTPITIPVASSKFDREDYPISDDMLALCTFVLTDGHLKHGEGGRRTTVHVYKSPKRWGNEELQDIFARLGLEYQIRTLDSCFGGTVTAYELSTDNSVEVVRLLNDTKKSLPDWMAKLSRRQAQLVIDLWAQLDGHTAENEYGRQKLQCDNMSIANQLQELCVIAGHGSTINTRYIGNNKAPTIYVIPFIRDKKSLQNKETVHYQGKVWCPTTEDGVVFFRRRGSVFVSGNSPFTNLSVYDDNFLDKLCTDYIFPDGSTPDKEIVKKLQNIYLDIMNEELQRTPLTFPVTTACFSIDKDNNIQDEAFLHNIAQKNLQWGFINMYAGSSSTLSSCCRLRSEQQSEYFNSFGSGSSKIGSLGVCTINFPRLAIQYPLEEDFMEKLEEMVGVCAKVNNAKRHIVQKRINNGNEPLYKYEFMELSKQYSTCGVNGFYETIKLLGYDILTEEGQALALRILDKINDTNKIYQNKYKMPHNVEQVPGENLSIKLAEKDKLMGYQNEYNLYSNQFIPLIANADLFDRIKLQGLFDSHFSGGSICHLNVETQITDVKNMEDLIRVAAKKGVVYFAINYVLSQCTNGHMSVTNGDKCLVCGEPITDKYSRVVGFLTNIKNWHKVRREEDFPNRQFYQGEEIAPPEEEIEKVDLARNAKE